MSARNQINILLDEYASGERPQNEVTQDIMSLIEDAYEEGNRDGSHSGYHDGYDDGYDSGFADGGRQNA